jgi:hypothetical protein
MAELFNSLGRDQLSSEELVAHLVTMDERPWPEWYRGKPLTQRSLARLLAPFGIRPKAMWIGGRTVRGYSQDDLGEPLLRYRPPAQVQGPQEWLSKATDGRSEKCKAGGHLADAESARNPHGSADLAGLADESGDVGGVEDEGWMF